MSASARRIAQACLVVLLLSSSQLRADEPGSSPALTAAESEYIALAEEFNQRLEVFWQEESELTDAKQAEEFHEEHDPGIEFVPKLLAFEESHQGEDVGLDALGEIVSYAGRSGNPDSYLVPARREALARMQPYEARALASLVVRRLKSGAFDPQVLDYLQRLAKSTEADPTLRAVAKVTFADQVLSSRELRKVIDDRLRDFAAGMPAKFPEQADYLREIVESLPPIADIDARADEAIAMLEELAATGDEFRAPEYHKIDPNNHLIRIDAEKSKNGTLLSERAAGVLFQERHLRLRQSVPNLEIELIDGQPWSLDSHRGKVVVVQFSFTGCGPCEAMYPDLRNMKEELGDRVEIVTILRDETPTQAKQAQESGKITWPIHCDGVPGKLCTQWAVDAFPEIYVIDPTGQIAANGYRDEALRWKVEQLLAADTP